MSKKGKNPVELPTGVDAKIENKNIIVKGPKGELTQPILEGLNVTIEDKKVLVTPEKNNGTNFQGLLRTLILNMVSGVTTGFTKSLEMIGVGYRAAVKGTQVDLQVGKSHPTLLDIPKGITVTVEKNTKITVQGHDKQLVGQFAAEIRRQRPPEVYQGKGIRYQGEYVRKKAGKAAATK